MLPVTSLGDVKLLQSLTAAGGHIVLPSSSIRDFAFRKGQSSIPRPGEWVQEPYHTVTRMTGAGPVLLYLHSVCRALPALNHAVALLSQFQPG